MKFHFLFVLLIIAAKTLTAQNYNGPESIVYDPAGNRYFVSNVSGNTIVQVDTLMNVTNFVSDGLFEPKGLIIVGDTLISANSTSVKGFLLGDASKVMDIAVDESIFMNDVTTDGSGNLYISDMDKNSLYKLSLKTGEYSTLLNNIASPNGVLYNPSTHAVLICNWGNNAKIQSFSIADSVLSTLVTTKLSNLDGLATDNCGNYYVSSWGTNAVYVFDPLFQSPPTRIVAGQNGPADITINIDDQILAIPNLNSNSIKLISLGIECGQTTTLIQPQHESVIMSNPVIFEWQEIIEAGGYELEISKDSMFYSGVKRLMVVATDTTVSDLDLSATYFWRVRGLGGDFKNLHSEINSFSTSIISQVSQIQGDKSVFIYPNPVNDLLTLKCSISENLGQLSIIDLTGRIINTVDVLIQNNEAQIDVSHLQQGMYWLKLNAGNVVTAIKFSKL